MGREYKTAGVVSRTPRTPPDREAINASWLSASAARAIAVWVPPALVLLLGLLVGAGTYRADAADRNVQRTYTILVQLHFLQSRLVDAETAARGFALTGEEPFL